MHQVTIGSTQQYYQNLWDKHVIREDWKLEAIKSAKLILQGKDIYTKLCHNINERMPWYVPGIIHMMESTCNFRRHLHNGDPLSARTMHVPSGRPLTGKPPFSWLQSAADALTMKGIEFHKYNSWRIDEILYRLECYNGLGYRNRKVTSPYLWAGTTYYTKGKYGADSRFDPELVSEQVGAAVLLRYVTDKTLNLVQ